MRKKVLKWIAVNGLLGFISANIFFGLPQAALAANKDEQNRDLMSLISEEGLPIISGDQKDLTWEMIDEYYGFSNTAPVTRDEINEQAWLDQEIARKYLDITEDLKLREIDKKATELVKEFHGAKNGVPPVQGNNGVVQVAYGSYNPKVVCRPMRVTDIMLEPGERVTGVHAGDTVRWKYTPGTSGSEPNQVTHVMVKPLAADISTNLIIHTDKRSYTIDLVSTNNEYFPSVSFSYPEDDMKLWGAFLSEKRRNEGTVLNEGLSTDPESMNFEYEIRGNQSWKPLRVWDDGRQVYIQMPKGWERSGMEAPVLIVYERKKERIVNYRVKKDMIIVDSLFKEKCALIAGTGAHQDRVVILRKK
ncbi:hypothetical protein FACS1894187_14940 [Synergistales bacterium]|nr:hypothetical protein FACS1894187_14940 [Synergistales bacterium]